jgi:aspartate/methionine/tyrosine aminotransferase
VLSEKNLEDILKFCYENKMLVIADEVYQEITYTKPFFPAKKIMHSLGEPYRSKLELASLSSSAKSVMSECGLRGGYVELCNWDPFAQGQFAKLRTVGLCSNVLGQLAVLIIVLMNCLD